MKVLLHACCGPCLIEPLEALAAGNEVEVVYANPNIHPEEEYLRRRDTLLTYAEEHGWPVRVLDYTPDSWDAAVAGAERDPARRCTECYLLRLSLAASEAAAGGFDAFATTLTVSPYQDPDAIREAGEAAAASYGVRYLHADFRDRYPEATRRSREAGMYRQNYCGCRYSREEAESARAERRLRRAGIRSGDVG